jgi:HK97 family phage portal protein
MQQVLLEGNAFAIVGRNGRGEPGSILPVDSSSIEVVDEEGPYLYRAYGLDGAATMLRPEEVIHVPGLGDGIVGQSVLTYARETIGLGIAAEEYGARFFTNSARPAGVVEAQNELSETAAENLRDSFDRIYAGLGNVHRTAILEEGATYKRIGVTPEEAQFLETRKFTVTDVARVFRVPPHMIGDLEHGTFSNIEHESLNFVVHSIRPWLVRFEQEYNRKLFPTGRYFAEHNIDGLLRGDAASRMTAYSTGIQNGIYSVNDVRRLENMNPIGPEGDEHYIGQNMQTLADALLPPEPPPFEEEIEDDERNEDAE